MLNTHDLFDPFRFLDHLYEPSSRARSQKASGYRVETTDDGLTLSIDLPGVKSKDVTVQSVGRELKVCGKVRGEEFKHYYKLSKDYDADTAEALMEDGVLTLTFRKAKDTETRTIEVKTR